MTDIQPTGRLTFTRLLDWVEGRLDADEAALVGAAVDSAGPEVAETVAWIREFGRVAGVLPLQRPPAELSTRLRGLFRDHHAVGSRGWIEAVRRFDSRTEPLVGVRSALATRRAHLVYDGPFGAVVIDVDRVRPGHVDLRGYLSLVHGAEHGARVSLHVAGSPTRLATCDLDGRFELRDVPTTADELWVTQGETRVRVALDVRGG